jgi:hypothetical protein
MVKILFVRPCQIMSRFIENILREFKGTYFYTTSGEINCMQSPVRMAYQPPVSSTFLS